jgi:hypothetical protein
VTGRLGGQSVGLIGWSSRVGWWHGGLLAADEFNQVADRFDVEDVLAEPNFADFFEFGGGFGESQRIEA